MEIRALAINTNFNVSAGAPPSLSPKAPHITMHQAMRALDLYMTADCATEQTTIGNNPAVPIKWGRGRANSNQPNTIVVSTGAGQVYEWSGPYHYGGYPITNP